MNTAPYRCVHHSSGRSHAAEMALVLTAVGIENFLAQSEDGWQVYVDQEAYGTALAQLALYQQENSAPRIRRPRYTTIDSGWYGVLGYLGIIWLLPAAQSFVEPSLLGAGRLQAALVGQGEWWRAITALTLHADLAHIASNSLFGALFGLFVGRHMGSGLGWLLVLLSATVANLINAGIQPDRFSAIGASTATFAAMGMVPAFGWRRGYFRGSGGLREFAPLFGALALLSFTGFGGERVDMMGHVLGFIMGVGTGLAAASYRFEKHSIADQQRAGAFAVFLVVTAWVIALRVAE